MPKQPTTRENNPARQPRGRAAGAFDSLVQGTIEGVAQYSPERPRLLRDQSQSDRLIVGQTYGGPQGQSTWTQLAQLLEGGMKAAEGGVKAYAVVQDEIKRADAKSDQEVQREYELKMAELVSSELYQGMEGPQQLEERRKLHDGYKDRFVTDEGKHSWSIGGFKQKLEVQTTNAEAWYAENVNDQIRAINMNDALSDEMKANKIADVYDAALELADKNFTDNPTLRRAVLDKIIASNETAEKQVTAAARGLLADFKPELDNALASIVTDINNGVDIYAAYPGADRNTAFALEMSKRAGIDMDTLEPQYGKRVIAELRDDWSQLIESNYETVYKAENQQVIDRGMDRINAEQASLSNLDRPLGPKSTDGLVGAIKNLEQNTYVGPHTLTTAKLNALGTIMERVASDPRLDWTPKERETYAKDLVDQVAGELGFDREDGTTASRNFFEHVDAQFSQMEWDFIEDRFRQQDSFSLLTHAESNGNPNAFNVGIEPVLVQASDLVAEKFLRKMPEMVEYSLSLGMPFPDGFLTEQGQRDTQTALRVALIAAARGEDFDSVLKEEMGRYGFDDPNALKIVSNYVDTSEVSELLLAIDRHKDGQTRDAAKAVLRFVKENGTGERNGFTKEGRADDIFKQPTDLQIAIGASEKEGTWRAYSTDFHGRYRADKGEAPAFSSEEEFTADFRAFSEALIQDVNMLGAFNAVSDDKDTLQARIAQVYKTRYNQNPPQVVLDGLTDLVRQGGPSTDEAALFFNDMAQTYIDAGMSPYITRTKTLYNEDMRRALGDRMMYDLATEENRDQPWDMVSLTDALGRRGLRFTTSPSSKKINGIEAIPYENKVLAAVDEGRLADAVANGEWLEETTRFLEDKDVTEPSVAALKYVIETLGQDSNNARAMTAAAIPGIEMEEWEKFKECLFQDTLNPYNLEQSKFLLAAALIQEGIPLSEWQPQAFKHVRYTDGAITRTELGTLRINIANQEGEDIDMVLSDFFVTPYGGTISRVTTDIREFKAQYRGLPTLYTPAHEQEEDN